MTGRSTGKGSTSTKDDTGVIFVGELVKIYLSMFCLVCYVYQHESSKISVEDIYRDLGTSMFLLFNQSLWQGQRKTLHGSPLSHVYVNMCQLLWKHLC